MEFALALPAFVLMLYGLVTFGSVFYTQMVLSRAAADGARSLASVRGVTSFQSLSETDKNSIKLEVVNSLASSIVAPLSVTGQAARQTWLQENVLSQVTVEEGSCNTSGSVPGALRVKVVFPYSQVRILPSINLPMIGGMDSWMPETLTGCATAQI